MTLLVLLGVLAALAGLCSCQCPMSGCDGLRSFSSTPREAEKTTRSTITREEGPLPQLLWSYETHTPSGAGCVTNGPGDAAVVICPMAAGQNVSVVSFSAANGSVLWLLSLSSQAVLPLLSYSGQSVISDGQTLDWLAPDGRSLSPPVTLYPIQGLLFDLTITQSTSIVTMVYRCGFIATYTVDGVPISGLWLNDTRDGVKGTFVPLANPVMNDTRLYIISAFRAHTTDKREKQTNNRNATDNLLRLYAINVAEALVRKFTIIWTHDVKINGSIPYLNMNETYCNSTTAYSPSNERGAPNQSRYPRQPESPPGTVTMVGGRVLGSVRVETESGGSVSFNMSVRDLGKNYSVITSGYSNGSVTSFSWRNAEKLKSGSQSMPDVESSGFWVSVSLPGMNNNRTVLEELVELAGPPVNSSSLILPTSLTTPVTLLQYQTPTGVRGGVGGTVDEVLVFGAAGNVSEREVGNSQPQLVGVAGVGEKKGAQIYDLPTILWDVPLPHSQPAQGQISSLSLPGGRTLLFLTTPLGVYAYKLT